MSVSPDEAEIAETICQLNRARWSIGDTAFDYPSRRACVGA